MTTSRLDLMRHGLTIADASSLTGIPYTKLWRATRGVPLDASESFRLRRVLDEARKRSGVLVTA